MAVAKPVQGEVSEHLRGTADGLAMVTRPAFHEQRAKRAE